MKAFQLGIILIGVTFTLGAVTNLDWESTPEWSFQVYLDEDTNIKCNDSVSMLMSTDEIWWELPDGQKIHGWSNRNTSKIQLMDDNGIKGGKLIVKNVQHSDSGLYFCHVYRAGIFLRRINRAINLNGYLVKDQFQLYEVNVITAVVAALVFCVPFVFLCFLYSYRYRTPQEKQKIKEKNEYFHNLHQAIKNNQDYPEKPSKNGYDNAYDNAGYQNTHL